VTWQLSNPLRMLAKFAGKPVAELGTKSAARRDALTPVADRQSYANSVRTFAFP
jgi:hypothetical protein